jgi:hypothetical protein
VIRPLLCLAVWIVTAYPAVAQQSIRLPFQKPADYVVPAAPAASELDQPLPAELGMKRRFVRALAAHHVAQWELHYWQLQMFLDQGYDQPFPQPWSMVLQDDFLRDVQTAPEIPDAVPFPPQLNWYGKELPLSAPAIVGDLVVQEARDTLFYTRGQAGAGRFWVCTGKRPLAGKVVWIFDAVEAAKVRGMVIEWAAGVPNPFKKALNTDLR